MGAALGLAVTATIANSATKGALAGSERNPVVALTDGFQDAFLVCAGFAVMGAFVAYFLISSRDSREQAQAARQADAAAVPVAG